MVALDDTSLCYYRKVPKTFVQGRLDSMGDAKPKQSVSLAKITSVTLLSGHDMKKYKVLKKTDSKQTYVRIAFKRDGIVKGGLTDYDLDSDPEDQDKDDEK